MAKDSFWVIFSIFFTVSLVGVAINHIDDTDETYGYWEPVHFLLNDVGMQTWEYTQTFAIRTYSFVLPVAVIGYLLKLLGIDKIPLFYVLRGCFAFVSSIAMSNLVQSLETVFGTFISRTTLCLMLCSPGIFFATTSYLPSAVSMTLMTFAVSNWLIGNYVLCIACGCFAVLWTGWPFVGVILLPLGIHMLVATAATKGFSGVVVLTLSGAAVLFATVIPPLVIDSYMYGSITCPTWNILKYNALGSGDELYGVEPITYYLLNLLLTMGASWPLAILSPILVLFRLLLKSFTSSSSSGQVLDLGKYGVLLLCALLWLGILFSRPHKEERFLYPIYPFLAILAAVSLSCVQSFAQAFLSILLREPTILAATVVDVDVTSSQQVNKLDKQNSGKAKKLSSGQQRTSITLSRYLIVLVLMLAALIGGSRIYSNYMNYKGYFKVWVELSKQLNSELAATPNTITVCTGGEWYLFPNHFFLPKNARLAFVYDTFHGLLPRYFSLQGSKTNAFDDHFNDQNREDSRRYVSDLFQDCDYVVGVVDLKDNGSNEPTSPMMRDVLSMSPPHQNDDIVSKTTNESRFGTRIISELVIDSAASTSSIARAFYIPTLSEKRNRFKPYVVYKNRNKASVN